MNDDVRWVDPAKQLADWEAFEAAKRRAEREASEQIDPEWSNDEVLDMILSGCDRPGDHADASRFDTADLLDMWRTDLMLCPLHLDPEYPLVPSGVWSRQVARAWAQLAEATDRHTSQSTALLAHEAGLVPPDDEVCGHVFRITPRELRKTWDEHPHAAWWFEQQAEAGYLDIQVTA